MFRLSKSVYFKVKKMITSYQLWQKLRNLYEKKSVVLQIYWLKQLVDLKRKDGVTIFTHLNEFNSIFGHLNGKEIDFNDSLKSLFLLITLPKS